jgi:DNA replication protein DnaC
MSDKPFSLDDSDTQPAGTVAVPGTSITIRPKVEVVTAQPIAAALFERPDPLLQYLESVKNRTPAEIAAEQREIDERKAQVRRDEQAIALRDWEAACPPRLRFSSWAHPSLQPYLPHINRVLAWQRSGQGVYAVGLSGKGKSRALWQLARRLAVDEGVPVRYMAMGEIVNEVNRAGLNAWLDKVDALKNVPVLLWDDFGSFAAMNSRKDVLATELFDYRFNRELPNLISSNARAPALTKLFEERTEPLIRRLTEGSTVVDFDAK